MPEIPSASHCSRCTLAPSAGVARQLAWVRACGSRYDQEHLGNGGNGSDRGDRGDGWPRWLAVCHQVTPYLQRFGSDAALLDLGVCTAEEAVALMRALIAQLEHEGIIVSAAIGPTGVLAQFALMRLQATPSSPSAERLGLLTTEQTSALMQRLPVRALTRLRIADTIGITRDTVAQLERYGVRVLAQLARLDPEQLRRQFGAALGTLLATTARGKDPLPLQLTAPPLQLRFRWRLTTPLERDRLLAALPPFAGAIAVALAKRDLQASTLELSLCWERGDAHGVTTLTRTVSRPLASAPTFAELLERMLVPFLQTHRPHAIVDVRLVLARLVPLHPTQHAFWPRRTRRQAAIHELGDALAHRYGTAQVFRRVLTAPDAIFDQDRAFLAPVSAPRGSGVAEADALAYRAHGGGRPVADVTDVTDIADVADVARENAPGVDVAAPDGVSAAATAAGVLASLSHSCGGRRKPVVPGDQRG